MKNHSILTVGSIAFDSIETPSGKTDRALGGSVNYFSIAASFLSPVQVIGVVGNDFPKEHITWLESKGIDTSGIEIANGKTFHWAGEYSGTLDEAKTLTTNLNVFEHFAPKLSAKHKQADFVFLANIDPVLQNKVLDQIEHSKFVALDTMNFWIMSKVDELKKVLKRIDFLSINEGEAKLLTGTKNLFESAKQILAMGPAAVVIKRGDNGAALFTPEGCFIAPAYPTSKVVDPTGAGDSFAGAMMGYLCKNLINREILKNDPMRFDRELRKAVVYGCTMASFTVEDFGINRLKNLSLNDFNHRKEDFFKMLELPAGGHH